jgi:hypothetical protein
MAITISPNENVTAVVGIPVCFEAVGTVVIPQQDERCIDLPASGTNWAFNSALCKWTKTGGSSTGTADAPATVAETIHALQPFYILGINLTFTTPPAPNRFYGSYIGVKKDITGTFYGFYIWKNCGNQAPGDCNATTSGNADQNWKAFVMVNDVVVNPIPFGVNASEIFRVRSNGVSLYWEWQTAGIWRLVHSIALPEAETFAYHLNSGHLNNEWHFLKTFKGTFQGTVPLTWTAPLGGTITGTGNNRCFSAGIAGSYQVCVDSDFDDPVCVDVDVAPLYLQPVDYACNDCVFTGDIIRFESNGGLDGVLTATSTATLQPSGVIIDALTWQAPGSPDTVDLEYTIGGESTLCFLRVVDRIKILNIEGNTLTGLVPGEEFQIITNYMVDNTGGPTPEVETVALVWENVTCPNIVDPYGLIKIPARANDDCFGALDCIIRAQFVGAPEAICGNLTDGSVFVDIRVIVDPVFPTPDYGGPVPVKWKPETPEFKVLVNEFDGGCDETHLKNRVPRQRWTVRYSGLAYDNESPCQDVSCCDDAQGYKDGYDPKYHVAKRLDDFWMVVGGESGYFTLFDYRTKEIWRRVRFDGTLGRDHINWKNIQSRDFTMMWAPCCATSPASGCPHNSGIRDALNPTTPSGLNAVTINWNSIQVTWGSSIDNVGIKYYELEIDGVPTNVGNVLSYTHIGLQPSTVHNYRIRAFDYSGNFSDWTAIDSATTDAHDIISPSIPTGLTVTPQTATSWLIEWDASTDNTAVVGYKLMINGYVVDVGNVLNYLHTIAVPTLDQQVYRVRAYDAAGNQSKWSAEVIEGFNYIYEGGQLLQQGVDLIYD